jgi:hypothetical protein
MSAEWLLELWEAASTPQKASRLREASVTAIPKRCRIRRLAAGTVEAASAHVASLIPRIRLINHQIKEAERRIDVLIARLAPPGDCGEAEPGQKTQMTRRSTHPCREWEGPSSNCSQRRQTRCSAEITPPCAA